MSKETGGPAFPGTYTARSDQGRGPVTEFHDKGLSLRDYFAAKAMQSMVAAEFAEKHDEKYWAESAYKMADAMIAARSQS